jgi:glycosyltransferase involved in cell wall biosynthesis
MACGLPVLTTRVGGVAEVVADGETGYLVKAEDVETLRAHILRLAADDQLVRRMGIAANKRVSTFFNARTQAASIVTLLCQIADEHRAGRQRAR